MKTIKLIHSPIFAKDYLPHEFPDNTPEGQHLFLSCLIHTTLKDNYHLLSLYGSEEPGRILAQTMQETYELIPIPKESLIAIINRFFVESDENNRLYAGAVDNYRRVRFELDGVGSIDCVVVLSADKIRCDIIIPVNIPAEIREGFTNAFRKFWKT